MSVRQHSFDQRESKKIQEALVRILCYVFWMAMGEGIWIHGIFPTSIFGPLKSYNKLAALEQLQTLLVIPKNIKALMTN